MFEVIMLSLAVLLITACAFFPSDRSTPFSSSSLQSDIASDSESDAELSLLEEEAALKQSFLAHLQSEIESALFPRPTDSVLRRHYDALVSAEVENRLAAMPDS